MIKKLFMSVILLLAALSLVVSLMKGNNNREMGLSAAECVAVIDIMGPITSGAAKAGVLSQAGGTSSREIMEQIREASEDIMVRALLLNINSPGGSATAAEEISRELLRFKQVSKKPIVATMGDMGASAAYWIAAAASDVIYANNTTLTGSIGVYVPYMNVQELLGKLGVDSGMIASGKHKGMLSPDRELTEEEKAIIQDIVKEIHEEFINAVAKGRKMDGQELRSKADGSMFTGKQAKNMGLIDEIGNYYDALARAAKMGGIEGHPEVRVWRQATPWEALLGAKILEAVQARFQQSIESKLAAGVVAR